MLNQAQALELKEQFVKLSIPFDIEQFNLALRQVTMDNVNIDKIIQKIQVLRKILTQAVYDDEPTRDSYFLLNNIYDARTLNCFANNETYFRNLTDQFERLRWCLKAALIGSIELAESLFDNESINPKDNTYILSYAIYSGNSTWVKQIVEKWHVNIKNPEYCFRLYAERIKDEELLNYFFAYSENTALEKQAIKFHEATPSPSSSFFKEKTFSKEEKKIIKQKLLESFTEIILGELEELIELKNDEAKDLLINILFDSSRSVEEVVKFASELDPILSKRFAIIYCCMNKEKWEDMLMKKYYKPLLIDKYIESYPHESESRKELMSSWLKNYAKLIIEIVFSEKKVHLADLNLSEKIKKDMILERISKLQLNDEELLEDSKHLEEEINNINALIDQEGTTEIANNLLTGKILFNSKYNIKKYVPLVNINQLSVLNEPWKEIYSLIKKTAKRINLSENQMLGIVRAIIYKENTGCRWKDLPQWMPKETTVRHFFYEWLNNGIMEDIITKYSEPVKATTSSLK